MNNGHHTLERQGCTLHYCLAGVEGKPLLVFTHGAAVDHRMFDEQVKAFEADFRVLTWDMRGHGQSRPTGEPFTVTGAVTDLLAILDAVGARQAVFIGQSTGGYVHQELVFRQPERVTALVMVDCVCITFKLSAMDALLLRMSPALMRLFPHSQLVKQSVDGTSIKPDVKAYLTEVMGSLSKAEFISIWTGVAKSMHYEPDYRITQPMLIVRGEQDKLGNIAKDAPKWAARDSAVLVVIPDAGHVSNQDNPTFFNRILREFLQPFQSNR
ncbi:MAG: alpha/beta hydrolase [Chloroflexi bacterium]|nr:alpha/beta hydrolase [Chloroflexota bacterium]